MISNQNHKRRQATEIFSQFSIFVSRSNQQVITDDLFSALYIEKCKEI